MLPLTAMKCPPLTFKHIRQKRFPIDSDDENDDDKEDKVGRLFCFYH